MKRTVITVDGNGRLSIPSNVEDLWMSENELVDMLYVTTPKLKAVIRAIYKGRYVVDVGSPKEAKTFQRCLANAVWIPYGCCHLLPSNLQWCSATS